MITKVSFNLGNQFGSLKKRKLFVLFLLILPDLEREKVVSWTAASKAAVEDLVESKE